MENMYNPIDEIKIIFESNKYISNLVQQYLSENKGNFSVKNLYLVALNWDRNKPDWDRNRPDYFRFLHALCHICHIHPVSDDVVLNLFRPQSIFDFEESRFYFNGMVVFVKKIFGGFESHLGTKKYTINSILLSKSHDEADDASWNNLILARDVNKDVWFIPKSKGDEVVIVTPNAKKHLYLSI